MIEVLRIKVLKVCLTDKQVKPVMELGNMSI